MFYPIPVTNEATLTLTVTEPIQLQGRIFDNTGKMIKIQQWQLNIGSNAVAVDTRTLASGLYYLSLNGGNINEQKQFVKQ